MKTRSTILSIAGHDPTGGAGIQADIETINDLGGHACSIITAVTVQNSQNLHSFEPVDAELIQRQFHCLIEDFKISAVKIGLIGSAELVDVLADLLSLLPGVPVIVDPILAAGGGKSVSSETFIKQLREQLIPVTTMITPNVPEAQKLTGKASVDECAKDLMQLGCPHVLVTGTHAESEHVINRLYSDTNGKLSLKAIRLPGIYHGSGCTLSSALAYFLAADHSVTNAVKLAQDYTFNSLSNADNPGNGQAFPARNKRLWQISD